MTTPNLRPTTGTDSAYVRKENRSLVALVLGILLVGTVSGGIYFAFNHDFENTSLSSEPDSSKTEESIRVGAIGERGAAKAEADTPPVAPSESAPITP